MLGLPPGSITEHYQLAKQGTLSHSWSLSNQFQMSLSLAITQNMPGHAA